MCIRDRSYAPKRIACAHRVAARSAALLYVDIQHLSGIDQAGICDMVDARQILHGGAKAPGNAPKRIPLAHGIGLHRMTSERRSVVEPTLWD